MSKDALKKTIDRMVEDAIRRILPDVMSEVLLRTVANAGVVTEKKAPQQKSRPQNVASPQTSHARPARRKPSISSLREILQEDAGAEFYQDPRGTPPQTMDDVDLELDDDQDDAPVREVRNHVMSNPMLAQMAEGIDLDDDGVGEMWDGTSGDSAVGSVDPTPIRDPNAAAARVGIDFNRLSKVVKQTSPVQKRQDSHDAAAKAQFEQGRITRMREQLERKA